MAIGPPRSAAHNFGSIGGRARALSAAPTAPLPISPQSFVSLQRGSTGTGMRRPAFCLNAWLRAEQEGGPYQRAPGIANARARAHLNSTLQLSSNLSPFTFSRYRFVMNTATVAERLTPLAIWSRIWPRIFSSSNHVSKPLAFSAAFTRFTCSDAAGATLGRR